jgi:hypothetical protein
MKVTLQAVIRGTVDLDSVIHPDGWRGYDDTHIKSVSFAGTVGTMYLSTLLELLKDYPLFFSCALTFYLLKRTYLHTLLSAEIGVRIMPAGRRTRVIGPAPTFTPGLLNALALIVLA